MFQLPKFACALLCLSVPFIAHAAEEAVEATQHDPFVEAQLDAMDIPYVVDEDGDFRILVALEDERTQVVWVRSRTHTTGSQRIREIWTYGMRSDERRIPAHIANRLLKENSELVLGSWARHDGNAVLILRIQADAEASVLDESIDLAASLGDQMEQRLVSGDEL